MVRYYSVVSFLAFLILGFSCSQNLVAQEGTYTIQWENNQTTFLHHTDSVVEVEYLYFEGAIYSDDFLIPRYAKSLQLTSYDPNDSFQIRNMKFQPVPDSLLKNIDYSFFPEYSASARQFKAGTVAYLDLFVDAIRQNPETGKVERLLSFDLINKGSTHAKSMLKKATSISPVNSFLAEGNWYKLKVEETGIYKLTYKDLKELGFENPVNIRLYGHGGKQLSYFNGDPRPVDMVEIPIYLDKGGDGVFNDGDFILFYAEGPVTWSLDTLTGQYEHDLHHYSDAIFYFLTNSYGPATEITSAAEITAPHTHSSDTYDDYAWYEEERLSIIGSGRNWWSAPFDENQLEKSFTFENLQPGGEVSIKARVAARSQISRYAHMLLDGNEVDNALVAAADFRASYYQFANEADLFYNWNATKNNFNLQFAYDQYEVADFAYLDYITLSARSKLQLNSGVLLFRDKQNIGAGNISRYTIANANASTQVWDVTDIHNVKRVPGSMEGTNFTFKISSDSLRQFVALNPQSTFPKPIVAKNETGFSAGPVNNQNLRGISLVNYLIIAPEEFLNQANRLADWHRSNSELTVTVVTPEEIYNEFSSGTPDVSALRDFIRYHYLKGTNSDSLKYVLLFGDGSYNNHMYVEGNTNYILTYQSINSLKGTESYAADDFFGLLDENEGGTALNTSTKSDLVGKLDVGVGRFPVKLVNGSDIEAKLVVDKVMGYHEKTYYDWRRDLCFAGDDGDGNWHMNHANKITELIDERYDGFEYKKILIDAYEQVSNSSGAFYPEAKKDLITSINKGILLFNYFGHGSENQLTDERILQKADVVSLKNEFLPLFITATCQFSRYDDVEVKLFDDKITVNAKTSAGEEALLNADGGAIALLTTSRVVYSSRNFALASKLFSCIFDKDESGKPLRLGDVLRKSKNGLSDEVNKLNFSLLGDPALRLAFPQYQVITDSINGYSVHELSDTLKAFSEVTVSGYVAYDDSTIISNFSGIVYPRVYDKETRVITLANDPEATPFEFNSRNSLIYKGKATVENGRFRFTFMVPKDISYNLGKGKISYYAENGTIDARGEYGEVFVGGTNTNAELDYTGPEIDLYLNDENFEEGGITNEDPFIYARISDENGINTTGNGIGHDIVAMLNYDASQSYVLNDYYEADIDQYTSGSVRYQLFDLEEGEHTISLKAWDVFNNSSEVFIDFVVKNGDGPVIDKLLNFPNPATSYTSFQYKHNVPGEHTVTLDVFDVSGRLVTSLTRTLEEQGFVSTPIYWELNNHGGNTLRNGIYPYRLILETSEGKVVVSDKLVIVR